MPGPIQTLDGVAFFARGDLALVVYQRAARLHRTRWLFDRLDEHAASVPGGILVLLVVLPSADPPDGPTRQENTLRTRKLAGALRRLVTVPVGDAFRVAVVRTVMRALAILQGNRRTHFISETIVEGISKAMEAATPDTPTRAKILEDLEALHSALGERMASGRMSGAA
jgi:hypothetical protein